MRRWLVAASVWLWCGAGGPATAWAQTVGAQTGGAQTGGAQTNVAQTGAVGLWRTLDDKSGEARAEVRLFEAGGVLYGRVERVFDPVAAAASCDKCTGDRRGKPLIGLDIVRGLRPDGAGGWSGGEILDPETGDSYRVTVKVAEQGRKLIVRGSVLGGLVGRSQTWVRAAGS